MQIQISLISHSTISYFDYALSSLTLKPLSKHNVTVVVSGFQKNCLVKLFWILHSFVEKDTCRLAIMYTELCKYTHL